MHYSLGNQGLFFIISVSLGTAVLCHLGSLPQPGTQVVIMSVIFSWGMGAKGPLAREAGVPPAGRHRQVKHKCVWWPLGGYVDKKLTRSDCEEIEGGHFGR